MAVVTNLVEQQIADPITRSPGVIRFDRTVTVRAVFGGQNDPDEKVELWNKEGYAHLWVTKPVMEILAGLKTSMQEYPNIQPGQEFDGYR